MEISNARHIQDIEKKQDLMAEDIKEIKQIIKDFNAPVQPSLKQSLNIETITSKYSNSDTDSHEMTVDEEKQTSNSPKLKNDMKATTFKKWRRSWKKYYKKKLNNKTDAFKLQKLKEHVEENEIAKNSIQSVNMDEGNYQHALTTLEGKFTIERNQVM